MKLGIGSYTYVWWAGVPGYPPPADPLTPDKLLDVAVSLGVDLVQIADNMPLHSMPEGELRALAARASDRAIELEIGTRGVEPGHLREYLRIAGILRARFIRTLLDAPGHQPTAGEAVSLLREVARDYESAGVTLGIENHDRFRAAELRRIIEDVGSSAIGVCLDTANSLGCGEGIHEVLDALAVHVVNLHVKDFTVRRLPHNKGFIVEGAPAGSGTLDIPEVLERLRGHGRDVNAVLEQWPPLLDSVDASVDRERAWAEQGIRYLRTLIPVAMKNVGKTEVPKG